MGWGVIRWDGEGLGGMGRDGVMINLVNQAKCFCLFLNGVSYT